MEQPGLPMNVSAVLVLEPGPRLTLEKLRQAIAPRLRRLPRFHQKLAGGPWTLNRPHWEPVPRINLARHLFRHTLPAPGSRAQLDAMCAQIQEQALSREKPLWEIHLIDGQRDGQCIVVKMHHAITDGIAGVAIAQRLFDGEAGRRAEADRQLPGFADSMRPSLLTAAQTMLGIAATAASGPIALAGPFNGHVGPRRSFATTTIPLDLIRLAKQRDGGTVDDVFVAIVASGLRDYLAGVAYPGVPHALRAMLPVSTRTAGGDGLGNHVTAVFLDLPMMPLEFGALVRAIATSKSDLRAAHAATGAIAAVRAAGLLPNPLHSAVVHIASATRCCNLVLSDVPAPGMSLSLLGRRVSVSYPVMPLGASIGLSIAALGSDGQLGVGITADPEIVPDVHRIAVAIHHVVVDLDHALRHRAHAPRAA